MRTRTRLGAAVSSLLHLSPGDLLSPSKSLFPLPLPFFGAFRNFGPRLSSRARTRIGIRRVAVVTTVALNMLHSGGRPPSPQQMRRLPNEAQSKALSYIVKLIRTCGAVAGVDVPAASRRSAQLVARLSEISEEFTALGPSCDPYGPAFPGVRPSAEDNFAALHPYKDLDANRLVLSGEANWDPSDFLDDSLYLSYREPQSLLRACIPPPPRGEVPDLTREDPRQVLALARLWDSKSLLRLSLTGPPQERPWEAVRVFNAAKNASTDRQIGDRRGRNHCEGTIPGPSRFLPQGPMLGALHLQPDSQRFSINVTDRRDYYHQLRASASRAQCNILVPPLKAAELKDLQAFKQLCAFDSPKAAREDVGDFLLDTARRPPKVSVIKDASLYACFGAVLQGDALGVEYATSSHANLLSRAGLLAEDSRILAGHPFPLGGPGSLFEGLVIDDYFSVSNAPLSSSAQPSATAALHRARDVYREHGREGRRRRRRRHCLWGRARLLSRDARPWSRSRRPST